MKIYHLLLVLLIAMNLAGCASLSFSPHPGKIEHVGVLLIKNCAHISQPDGCERFSLLEQDMQTPDVALSGNIDESLDGRLIAVLGTEQPARNGLTVIDVEQSKSISKYNYRPFLGKAVGEYTRQNYNCVSFWDQNYSWRLDEGEPILIVTLRPPSKAGSGLVQLEFDGLSQILLSAKSNPENANPCLLR